MCAATGRPNPTGHHATPLCEQGGALWRTQVTYGDTSSPSNPSGIPEVHIIDASTDRGFTQGYEYYGTFTRALFTLFQVRTVSLALAPRHTLSARRAHRASLRCAASVVVAPSHALLMHAYACR